MHGIRNLQSQYAQNWLYASTFPSTFSYHSKPAITGEATKRAIKKLDANYEAADLTKVVENNCAHLTRAEKSQLLQLLTEFQQLFDGTLGDWKTSPAKLELKREHSPYHGKAYPIPKIHKDVFRKEVDRLEELGVLKWEGDPEWASPNFIVPKKQGTVHFDWF